MILEVHSDIQTSQMELLAKERFLTVFALNTPLDLYADYFIIATGYVGCQIYGKDFPEKTLLLDNV